MNSNKLRAIIYAVLCMLLFLLTQIAASFIGSVIIVMRSVSDLSDMAEINTKAAEIVSSNMAVFSIIGSLIFIFIVLIAVKTRGKKFSLKSPKLDISACILSVLAILLFSSSWNIALQIFAVPEILMGNTAEMDMLIRKNLFTYNLAVFVVGPIAEEIAFRGVIMTKHYTAFSAPVTIIISALLFGLSHFMTGSILTILFAFLGGLIFALAYEKTGSLMIAIIVHIVGNLCSFTSYLAEIFPAAMLYFISGISMVGAIISFYKLAQKTPMYHNGKN